MQSFFFFLEGCWFLNPVQFTLYFLEKVVSVIWARQFSSIQNWVVLFALISFRQWGFPFFFFLFWCSGHTPCGIRLIYLGLMRWFLYRALRGKDNSLTADLLYLLPVRMQDLWIVMIKFSVRLNLQIINDQRTRGKCYCFVTFTNPRSAIDAINDMNGRVWNCYFICLFVYLLNEYNKPAPLWVLIIFFVLL